jgi:hypothetical protein
MIFASTEVQSPTRQEIVALIERAPSLHRLSEMGAGDLHGLENDWHKIYIGWHSILGQLKIQQRNGKTSFFGGKK